MSDQGDWRFQGHAQRRRMGAPSVAAAAATGPNYDPSSNFDRQYEYNEGYQHAMTGAEYKGYGGRPAAIAYGAGWKHGQQDLAGASPAPKKKKTTAKRSK